MKAVGLAILFTALVGWVLPSSSDSDRTAPAQSAPTRRDNPHESDPFADTLVLCPPQFQPALTPWLVWREGQGHRIEVVTPRPTPLENRELIRERAVFGHLQNLWIVGDSGDRQQPDRCLVPTDYITAEVNVLFGSDPQIATDHTYADPDGDGIPELAVGRLPVDSVEQLSQQIRKIIRYEQSDSDSEWQRRINLIAGVGGFGRLVDKLIEQSTRQLVTDLIPGSFQTSVTYGSWASTYCPDPRRFSETAIERFNEGCLFWVYIGHGSRHQLDRVRLPDQSHPILDCADCRALGARQGNPIAIFLACYTGAMDGPQDCLAEEMLLRDDGPIAVIGGSRVTMPYAMGLLSLELMREYFDGDAVTLGQLLKVAKQRMAERSGEESGDDYRSLIETMGQVFSPQPGLLEAERREHLHLMHLIGDPLLRIKRPQRLSLSAPPRAHRGDAVWVTGNCPRAGRYTIEVAYRRDRFRHRPPFRGTYRSGDAIFEGYQEAYDRARDLVCYRAEHSLPAGAFRTSLRLPEDANGECVISVFNAEGAELVLGDTPIFIADPPTRVGTSSPPPTVR